MVLASTWKMRASSACRSPSVVAPATATGITRFLKLTATVPSPCCSSFFFAPNHIVARGARESWGWGCLGVSNGDGGCTESETQVKIPDQTTRWPGQGDHDLPWPASPSVVASNTFSPVSSSPVCSSLLIILVEKRPGAADSVYRLPVSPIVSISRY